MFFAKILCFVKETNAFFYLLTLFVDCFNCDELDCYNFIAFLSGELDESSTCSILEHVGNDGRQVYGTKYYNLDAILSVGYRVNSKNATQFRIWANKVLKEYLVKGYAINDRLAAQKYEELSQLVHIYQQEQLTLTPPPPSSSHTPGLHHALWS